jgi:glyoxylase-like metal-dependent hydrolase (beta-lactamase superfamily II)
VVRAGDECFVVDSPVLPSELEALPALLQQAGFSLSGLLATHADWDHLLGRLAFPDAALGVCETTAARLTGAPGEAARELRAFDEQWYVQRPAPLQLGSVQALPVPGRVDIGSAELELHPADGHTVDGMAVWIPWARVLIAGDYLSPVEIPMVVDRGAYRATLERLRPLVEAADWVVPGHGDVLDGARALAILREDMQYLEDFTLPLARRSGEQRRIDAANRERLA